MARLGRFIRAASISDAWQRGLNLIWRQGAEITDERGTRIKEILSLQMVVEDPYREMIPAGYSWNEERLEEYARQLLSGSNPGFEYTYGERLRAWAIPGTPALDQIQQAIARLRASSSTRRATAVTWIVPVDSNKEEVPCMIVDDFKLRDGRLHLIHILPQPRLCRGLSRQPLRPGPPLAVCGRRCRRRAGVDIHHQRLGSYL